MKKIGKDVQDENKEIIKIHISNRYVYYKLVGRSFNIFSIQDLYDKDSALRECNKNFKH